MSWRAWLGGIFVGVGLLAGGSAAALEQDQLWIYDPKGRCDPFVALVREERSVPCDSRPGGANPEQPAGHAPSLGGMLWDPGGQSIALLNGGEAKVGDEIDGYRVTAIRQDEVVLTRGQDRVVLRINFETQPPKAGESSRREVRGR